MYVYRFVAPHANLRCTRQALFGFPKDFQAPGSRGDGGEAGGGEGEPRWKSRKGPARTAEVGVRGHEPIEGEPRWKSGKRVLCGSHRVAGMCNLSQVCFFSL